MIYKVAKEKKGITLIALVITIIIIIILATVTVNFLFGENGLITMAQKAKDQYEEAAKNEEQQLAGIFGKNFADYNGQLSVVDGKLVNQYNEVLTLKGLVADNVSSYSIHYTESKSFNYYLNQESINNLKDWNVNVIRIGLEIDEVSDEEKMQDYLDTIDLLVDNDIYVIALLWNNEDINNNIEIAQQYFSRLAEKYNETNNVIYEIANEPSIDWNNIKDYSNTIISTIRNYDTKNIIIIPNPSADTRPDLVDINELNNSYNVMTSYHMYTGSGMSSERLNYLNNALKNKVPIFVTEWGTTLSNGNDGFYEQDSNIFVDLMDNYNLSWCNFVLTDYNFKIAHNDAQGNEEEYAGIVKHNQWNNSLSDDILTASGKYIKGILQGTYDLNVDASIMISRDNDVAFWQEEYIENIISIEFMKASEIPEDAVVTWDISALQDKSIQAYIIDDNGYKLYIISDYIIKLPIHAGSIYNIQSEGFFENFSNTKSIIFNNIDTSTCIDMSKMFLNCSNLEKIENIKSFNTKNVTWMFNMFSGCEKISELDLTDWNTKKVTQINDMFRGCRQLNKIIGIEDWDVFNVKICSSMFQQTYGLKELNLSNWNLNKVTDFSYMFAWCGATNIDIRNFNINSNATFNYTFRSTDNMENLYMNGFDLDMYNIDSYIDTFRYMKNGCNIYVKNEEVAKWVYDRTIEVDVSANIYYGEEENWVLY